MIINPAKMANPDDLVFYVKYHLKPEFVDEFQERLLGVVENMIKEESFVSAFVHQDAEDPTRFSMYERWKVSSKDAFMTYQMDAKAYRREYEERLPQISKSPRKIHLLRPMAFWANIDVEPGNEDLAFYVNFHIKPDRVDDWKQAALKVLNKMAEEDTFISTFLHQDAEDPTRFTLYERWNEPDLNLMIKKQKEKKYRKVYEDILPDMVQSLRTFRLLQPIGNWVGE
ncbi:MAG: putative quinol monooxygenase [Marinifilaceae bacterium]